MTSRDVQLAHLLMNGTRGLTLSGIHDALADIAAEEAKGKSDPAFLALLRRMLLRRLASFHRGRRGLIAVPEEEAF